MFLFAAYFAVFQLILLLVVFAGIVWFVALTALNFFLHSKIGLCVIFGLRHAAKFATCFMLHVDLLFVCLANSVYF